MMSSRSVLLAGTSLFGVVIGFYSQNIACASDTIVSSSTSSTVNWSLGSLTLTNSGTVSAASSGVIVGSSASVGTLSNNGSISGGYAAVYNLGSVAAIANAGTISGSSTNGIYNSGKLGTLSNTGKISGGTSGYGVYNDGTLGSVVNNGTISAGTSGFGVYNAASGVVSSISNAREITGGRAGLFNLGSVASIDNSGTISGTETSGVGLYNSGTIQTLTNESGGTLTGAMSGLDNVASGNIASILNGGTISGSGASGAGLYNAGTIGTLSNARGGAIAGYYTGLSNAGGIAAVSNSGTIIGAYFGLDNSSGGSIGTLTNAGTLSVVSTVLTVGTVTVGTVVNGIALNNNGLISAISNTSTGVIQSSVASGIAVSNTGTIGVLSNAGTISGYGTAIYNSGVIGSLVDTGVIAGNIVNASTNALTIDGASGSNYGTLTGYRSGSAGTITSTGADVIFGSGNILLNDNINVGSYGVVNSGATLKLGSTVTITGNYIQTGGGLVVVTSGNGSSYSSLIVSGNATVTGSTITISGSGLSKGETFMVVVPSGTGTYSNDTVTVVGTNGLSGSVSSVGNELVVTLSPTNYASIASSAGGNASSMGAFLTSALNSSNAAVVASQSAEVEFLSNLTKSQQATAIKQLAPIQITPSAVASSVVNATTSAVQTHQLAMSGNNETGAAAGSGGHDYAVWGQFLGGTSVRSTSASTDGFRTRNFGLMTGLDYTGDADVTVGGALSWLRGWYWGAGESTGNFVQSDSYQVTGYGQRRWGAAFVDAQLGLGYTTASQRRVFNLGTEANRADYDSRLYIARLAGGYDIPVRDMSVTPMIGWRYLRVVSGGYQETGATELWKVGKADVHTWTQDLGSKFAWQLDTAWGGLTPELRIAWVHDYNQAPITTYAFQYDQPAAATTTRAAADGARFNAAATLTQVGDVSLRLEYEGEFRPNYQSHSGLLKASLGF